jgi:3-deoxy-D-manno-octulosonic-acid transferase
MDERRKLEMLTLATYLYGKYKQWDNFKRQYILSKIAGAEYIYIGSQIKDYKMAERIIRDVIKDTLKKLESENDYLIPDHLVRAKHIFNNLKDAIVSEATYQAWVLSKYVPLTDTEYIIQIVYGIAKILHSKLEVEI